MAPTKEKEIIDRYKDTVYGIAYVRVGNRFDADDIFQDVFVVYFKRPRIFVNEGHRKGWFIKTTLILCKHYYKNRKSVEPLYDHHSVSNADHTYVLEALMSLKDPYKTVLYLYYFEGYKTQELATILKKKDATIRMQLKRGREQMKEILEENDE